MHDGRKKSIAGKISKLVENAEDPLTSRVNIERVIFRDGVSYKFTAGYVELLDNLIMRNSLKRILDQKLRA